jgi:hypothetical protein
MGGNQNSISLIRYDFNQEQSTGQPFIGNILAN